MAPHSSPHSASHSTPHSAPYSRPTRLGYTITIGSLLLISSAFWQEHAYAVYLGCALFACALLALLFTRINTTGIHSRWLIPVAAHAGQYTSIGAELSHRHKNTVPVHVYAWDARQDRIDMVATLPGLCSQESKIIWPMYFPKRGLVALPPLEVECEIPFGMFRSRVASSAIGNVIILPALGSVKKEFHIHLEMWLMQHQQSTASGSDELMHLRAYQYGDSPRLVHWRASARAQHLIVGLRSHMSDLHINLAVDCRVTIHGPANNNTPKNSRRFERLVSMAASIVHHAYQQGWSISLFGAFASSDGLHGSRQKLMEALACLDSVRCDNSDDNDDSTKDDTTDTSYDIHDYIAEHQGCMVLSLDEHTAQQQGCSYYCLADLEEKITLARERR